MGKLRLDKPRGIKSWFDIPAYEALKMEEVKIASIFRERGHYYAALSYEEEAGLKAKTGKKTAIDVNVGHFNYTEGRLMFCQQNYRNCTSESSIIKEYCLKREELTVNRQAKAIITCK